MTKHTPGPWEEKGIGKDTVGRTHRYICGQHKNSGAVLTVALATCGMVSKEAQKANAHLIAAAPETAAERDRLREINADLLAALKGLLAPHGGVYATHDVQDAARAAIVRAEAGK